jgi:hypothetical protein
MFQFNRINKYNKIIICNDSDPDMDQLMYSGLLRFLFPYAKIIWLDDPPDSVDENTILIGYESLVATCFNAYDKSVTEMILWWLRARLDGGEVIEERFEKLFERTANNWVFMLSVYTCFGEQITNKLGFKAPTDSDKYLITLLDDEATRDIPVRLMACFWEGVFNKLESSLFYYEKDIRFS